MTQILFRLLSKGVNGKRMLQEAAGNSLLHLGRWVKYYLLPFKEELEMCPLHWGTHPSLGELSWILDLVLTPWRTQWAQQE